MTTTIAANEKIAQVVSRLSSDWPKVHMQITEQTSLKGIFDSNIRPYRFPSLENKLLQAKHLRLNIKQSNGQIFPEFLTSKMDIHPLNIEGKPLLKIVATGSYRMTLPEARSAVSRWASNIDDRKLTDYFKKVTDEPNSSNERFVLQWSEVGIRYIYALRPSYDPTRPVIEEFSIYWEKTRKEKGMQLHDGPILPPDEYKFVDMSAPNNFGPNSDSLIQDEANRVQAAIKHDFKHRDSEEFEYRNAKSFKTDHVDKMAKNIEITTSLDSSSRSWTLWLIALFILSSIGFLIKLWKNNSTQ